MTINNKSISVLFLTKYARNGASSRYRSFQYFPYLEQQGIHCCVSSLFNESYLEKYNQSQKKDLSNIIQGYLQRFKILFSAKKFDLVVIEKEIFPYFPSIVEQYLNYQNIPYVVDYDDAIFHRYDQHPNKYIRWLLSKKIASVMRYSSLVIAGNDYLANYAQQANSPRVQIIPTVIDLNRYPLHQPIKNDIFTIGWIGSPSTTTYLQAIAPALTKVCEQGKKVQVVLIGATKFDLPNVKIENLAWSEDTEVSLLQQCDIGIMPLIDDPWARGKCGFKLIQYMACSLPVIASPVGVNNQIVEQGINGFLATTVEEWIEFLLILYGDFDLRAAMGKAGRKKVEQQYCLQVTAPQLAKCLQDTAELCFN